ncbi:MAG: apolipoprotein N-acyltransferase, partial [Bacteroidales bacterium]|nr:apolipoprotein N-acyltransferase [Bacteroidales bacterium]
SLGWTQWGLGLFVLLGFVPLLLIFYNDLKYSETKNKPKIFIWAWLSFLVWNSITSYWIYHSTLFGAIAAIFFSSLFMASVFWLAMFVWKKAGLRIGLISFVSFWLSFELLFMNSQISWPWLILGNAFANNISLVQWYEFVGHLGGSLWVLMINVLIFLIVKDLIFNKERSSCLKKSVFLAIVFLIPITYSFIRYYTYVERLNPVDIIVIQPNIDPYNEKFARPASEQISDMISLMNSKADENVDFVVAPETAMPTGMWEDEINDDKNIKSLRSFLSAYPNANIIIGADTRSIYWNGKNKTETARRLGKTEDFYDLYNTALMIDTSLDVQIYHKSKLVPGVEMMPYPKVLGFLGDFAVDLGGMSGSHGVQKERTVFIRKNDEIKTAAAICYESVYGEFFAEFVKNGALFMCIITNDGWWENTPGHRQHKSFASLRAIETRRSIARSANTGISCFVNQRGDILQATNWWQKDVIRAEINLNNKLTIYTKYGDFLARMSLVISGLLLLVLLSRMLMKYKPEETNKL